MVGIHEVTVWKKRFGPYEALSAMTIGFSNLDEE